MFLALGDFDGAERRKVRKKGFIEMEENKFEVEKSGITKGSVMRKVIIE